MTRMSTTSYGPRKETETPFGTPWMGTLLIARVVSFKPFAIFKIGGQGDLEEGPIDLHKLKSCITDRLELVSITLDSHDSPHRIFESLNNTGMRLGASDLIRNLIFMTIPDEVDAQNVYDEHWYPMQEHTAPHLDDFFWRYLMMDGSLPRLNETFDEVKLRLERSNPINTLKEFSKYAKYYRVLLGDEVDDVDSRLAIRIDRLRRWELDVSYPFLMRILNDLNDGSISLDDAIEVVSMIESFVVRRTVCAVPTNRLRRIFARLSSQVESADVVRSCREHLLSESWPPDGNFLEMFIHYPLYSGRQERMRLLLESLEESFEDKEKPAYILRRLRLSTSCRKPCLENGR